jgi:peptide deformylase
MTKNVKLYKGNLVDYEVYKLVDFYDPILRQPTKPFIFDSEDAKEKAAYIAFSMAETLERMQGLGLSANQVGLDLRVCAMNMGKEIWTMFNPEIIEHSSELNTEFSEGCLSYPGLFLKIPRYKSVKVRFQAIGGQFVEQELTGLTAVCFQHELDHLNGIVYTDRVSRIKLDLAKKKVKSNVKKMNRISEKIAQEREGTQSNLQIKEQVQEQPIKILDTSFLGTQEIQKKTPEKFVYNVE